jgi:phosphatidylglycerol:prolipoprotein diacylglycerol transferase
MFIENLNPVFLKIGSLEIRYYGLVMALGVLFGILIIMALARKKKIGIDKDILLEALFYMVLFGFIGARLDHILLHDTIFYLTHPIEIIAVWHGGMAAHGAFLGGFLALYFYCRKKRINLYKIADLAVVPLALGLAFGRIANFINGELYGKITSVPWAVKFPWVEGFRHPSQLYESATDFITFIALLVMTNKEAIRKRHKDGFIFWAFMFLYSLFRFFVEFFRQPDFLYFGLSLGQITCIGIIIVSIPFLIKFWKYEPKLKRKRIKYKRRK